MDVLRHLGRAEEVDMDAAPSADQTAIDRAAGEPLPDLGCSIRTGGLVGAGTREPELL